MAHYEFRGSFTNQTGSIGNIRIVAFDFARSSVYPVFEASWRQDGKPFDAYRLEENNAICEGCKHSELPAEVYGLMLSELTRLRFVLNNILGRAAVNKENEE